MRLVTFTYAWYQQEACDGYFRHPAPKEHSHLAHPIFRTDVEGCQHRSTMPADAHVRVEEAGQHQYRCFLSREEAGERKATERAKAGQKWYNNITPAPRESGPNTLSLLGTYIYLVAVLMPVGSAECLLKARCHQAPCIDHHFWRIRSPPSTFPLGWPKPNWHQGWRMIADSTALVPLANSSSDLFDHTLVQEFGAVCWPCPTAPLAAERSSLASRRQPWRLQSLR